ncbi:MAG: hypothetical protein COV46_01895 [Deltaproteobacteria bacterium CG11_big_fil_rev_8_21_14_0_20_49_13]|nr:MAG: hypothetical protein COV46_01895 [Deltaproteobacteria bacterium CG11_big_fil_rev_8_21_14_0_20_49_13]
MQHVISQNFLTICSATGGFPTVPGVYIMKGDGGEVLYIGKAKNLRKRVQSYFKKEAVARPQIKFLMERVADISFIETKTEKEAFLLEHKLIQEHKPKYNIELKDNKTFARIKLTLSHKFPGVYITRRIKMDKDKYFGPYVSAKECREMLEELVKFFRIRICSDPFFANRSRPCIQYDIGRCTAPCVGLVSKEKYAEQVVDAELFLKGENKDLIGALKKKMGAASEVLDFEEAARIRDIVSGIRRSLEKQSVLTPAGDEKMPRLNIYESIALKLKKKLKLSKDPLVIECVDISNIQGNVASGSIVAFVEGRPEKKRYRLFNITRDETPNDYAMMHEVLERRFAHKEWGYPDLLLVDGGRGHLSMACKVLESIDVQDVPVAAIAKIKSSHKRSGDYARIFLPNRVNPVKFKKGESALLYMIRIRDEAHRFGISHYRRRHSKKLTEI